MPISIYDSIAGQTPRDYFLETEGPLASDDTFKCTPIDLGAMFFETQTANYEAKAGEIVLANVEATGSFTIDLPASPLANQKIGAILKTKTTPGRTVTINPNGKNINGESGNIEIGVEGWGLVLQFDGSQWNIVQDLRLPTIETLTTTTKTSNYTASSGDLVQADVETAGSFTVTLPSSPTLDGRIGVILTTKTTATRAVTIDPNGKNINGSSSNVVLNVQDWALILQYDGTEWRIVTDLRKPTKILVREEQTSSTQSGSFSSGAWRTRVLNTKIFDTGGNASLASNQITLDPGTYRVVDSWTPANQVNRHVAQLYNVTAASQTLLGAGGYSAAANANAQNNSPIKGQFAITVQSVFELRHLCETTKTTNGFGIENSLTTEIYAFLELEKIA